MLIKKLGIRNGILHYFKKLNSEFAIFRLITLILQSNVAID